LRVRCGRWMNLPVLQRLLGAIRILWDSLGPAGIHWVQPASLFYFPALYPDGLSPSALGEDLLLFLLFLLFLLLLGMLVSSAEIDTSPSASLISNNINELSRKKPWAMCHDQRSPWRWNHSLASKCRNDLLSIRWKRPKVGDDCDPTSPDREWLESFGQPLKNLQLNPIAIRQDPWRRVKSNQRQQRHQRELIEITE